MAHSKTPSTAKIEKIARTVHEAIRGWRLANGQEGIPVWSEAPDWMVAATKESVQVVLENPKLSASAQHEQWMAAKLRDGWTLGAQKDLDQKTHPLLVPFDDLPEVERLKDILINSIVAALADIHA
ncbi:MAG: RyR domain-containing protein [Pseudomonadota bacterium]